MAKILTSEEWVAQYATKRVDVGRSANWFFTQPHTSGLHKHKLNTLQLLWKIAPERFSISPLHGEDNHFSVRIHYLGDYETIHINIVPRSTTISSATFVVKNKNGEYDIHTLWTNTRI